MTTTIPSGQPNHRFMRYVRPPIKEEEKLPPLVTCIDDAPSTMHELRVHPVGDPDTVCRVRIDDLALYD